MSGTVVIGSQFGDEGKGKITDFLAEKANLVVRYQGGNNAGHTVSANGITLKLHHLPSGAMYEKKIMIGAGCLIDPRVLILELEKIESEKLKLDLTIDPRCHIIMPYHNLLDDVESVENGEKVGTTKRGIGPAYADKALRIGVRFEDLINEKRLKEKLDAVFETKKNILEKVFGVKVPFSKEEVFSDYKKFGEKLLGFVGDVSIDVCDALQEEKRVLFEGAQGTFLDNDFGTYPFVTSSHPIASGAAVGVGMPLNKIERIIGVVKAYTTRVGGGPFPTELEGKEAHDLREAGKEFGTTTGRPRRVGWLDLPMLRTACRLNGFTELAITKLDVLSGMEKLKVAVEYEMSGKKFNNFPYSTRSLLKAKCYYKEFVGFTLSGEEKTFADLPKEAQNYLKFIETELKVPIKIVSIGKDREKTILID